MADDYRGLFEAAIARLQPGGAMEKAAFETIEAGKKTAVGGAIQNLVSGGMAGTTLAGSVPLIAEKGAAASRLGVTAAREQQLSGVQMALGGLLFQGSEREKAQQFTATQNALNQEFAARQAALNREYSSVEARKSEAYQAKQAQLTRSFTAAQNALDRQYGISTAQRAAANAATLQSSAQKFAAGESALGRTAAAAAYSGDGMSYMSAPDLFGGGISTGGGTSTGFDPWISLKGGSTGPLTALPEKMYPTSSYTVPPSASSNYEWGSTYETPTQMTNYGASTAPQKSPIQQYISDWLTYPSGGGGGGW